MRLGITISHEFVNKSVIGKKSFKNNAESMDLYRGDILCCGLQCSKLYGCHCCNSCDISDKSLVTKVIMSEIGKRESVCLFYTQQSFL